MMITNCPRCHEPYRIPGDSFPADAYAKCPWCHETFPLQEALRHLPPVLKIIGADGREMTGLGMTGFSNRMTASAASVGGTAYAANAAGLSNAKVVQIDDDLDGSVTFDTTNDFDQPSSPMRFEVESDDELDPEFVIQDASSAQTVAPMRVQPLPPLASSPRRKKKSSPVKLTRCCTWARDRDPSGGWDPTCLDYLGVKEAPILECGQWTAAIRRWQHRVTELPQPPCRAAESRALAQHRIHPKVALLAKSWGQTIPL